MATNQSSSTSTAVSEFEKKEKNMQDAMEILLRSLVEKNRLLEEWVEYYDNNYGGEDDGQLDLYWQTKSELGLLDEEEDANSNIRQRDTKSSS
jgi:hypothetical protein